MKRITEFGSLVVAAVSALVHQPGSAAPPAFNATIVGGVLADGTESP
jgi:hypothetical protein